MSFYYVGKKLVGFYHFVTRDNGALELDKFLIHPDYLGSKVGLSMWKACCEFAKQKGSREFSLLSDPYSEDFYLKLGCTRVGYRESTVMHRLFPVLQYNLATERSAKPLRQIA